jgi:8-oxo-dGTP pyrophosphatase MutT (NUDIX family)
MYGQTLMCFNPNKSCQICWDTNKKDRIRNVNECGVILFKKDMEELLIVYQSSSNKWGFPKGHMTTLERYNKEYFNCAKRELYEETNIDLRSHQYTKYGTLIIGNKLFYVIEVKAGQMYARPKDRAEIAKIRWIKRNNLQNFVLKNQCNITLKKLF